MQNKKDVNRHEKISEERIRLFDNDDFEEEIGEDDEDTAGLPRSLMLVDQLIFATPEDDGIRPLLYELRRAILEDEMTFQEARQTIVEMQQVVEKLTAPANRIGTLLGLPKKDVAHVIVGGSEYFANLHPQMDPSSLKIGYSVLLNEAYVVVGELGYNQSGPTGKIVDVMPDGRLRVGQEHGLQAVVLNRSTDLANAKLKANEEIRIDANFRVALERLEVKEVKDYFLEDVPQVPWTKIGGLNDTIQLIKDTIELPILYPDLFNRFQYAPPKGFLLYGPPGCGKTLIGKATAYNLTQRLRQETGSDVTGCFLHIKGPEILNMWLGESERKVREIFQIAREKRHEGFLPFVFIDEAESILGTRRSFRSHNISNTVVPMFCAEMDGLESLKDVVIILATNRPDLIDPAILRPGRIDRKIKVRRPDKEGAEEIARIYLASDLPIDPEVLETHNGNSEDAVSHLLDLVCSELFQRTESNKFLEVVLQNGRRDTLYRGDLCNGAIIASIIQRAKESAIKRAIERSEHIKEVDAPGDDGVGIRAGDLLDAVAAEYRENEIFPATDSVEDWLKLLDYDPEKVVKVTPFRPEKSNRRKSTATHVI
ncbi:MAG: AAA family ATPase [Candidatus Poribacteria bacterium]|nr:AAA family ATPase [Candidatus Poribacteria bacterium]